MTDVRDLRRRLGELADETPEVPPQQWLAATGDKIRVRRRARVWGTAGVALLVLLVAAAVAPRMIDLSAPEPARHAPSQIRHWEFVEGAPTDLVLDSRLNRPGASELSWTTSIPRGHPRWVVSSMQFCHLPRTGSAQRSEVRAVAYIHGRRVWSVRCRDWSGYPTVSGRMTMYWGSPPMSAFGIGPGEPFTVVMRLERDHQRVDVAGAHFGFALYRCGTQSKDSSGVGGSGLCRSFVMPLR
jgi:hypothetical protein